MKVLSVPMLSQLSGESGINTVIRHYHRLAPKYGIEYVTPNDPIDLVASHAGMFKPRSTDIPIVSHVHGMYWTADYDMPKWAHESNRRVADSMMTAATITVPSAWVADTIMRDLRVVPRILPHGIDVDEWPLVPPKDYVLAYAKNRAGVDVCNPAFLVQFAKRFPRLRFLSTFAPETAPDNVTVTGVLPHAEMKQAIGHARAFISTTKETFGITILEALASGVPVVAFREGGAVDLVQHGVNGYLAQPGNYDDLAQGLEYVLRHRAVLSANARELACQFSWDAVMNTLLNIYSETLEPKSLPGVTIVVPIYNKADTLSRTVNSCLVQKHLHEIILVDDGSTDGSTELAEEIAAEHDNIRLIKQANAGVAHARNAGIAAARTAFVCCVDSDDWLDERFLEACVPPLLADKRLGITYTGLTYHDQNGKTGLSQWPGEFDYDKMLKRQNQVPTCCVFRKEAWRRAGGYRNWYCEDGAGSEDAELWLRIGSIGYTAEKVTDAGLFHYSMGTGLVSGNREYREKDWLYWHPWVRDQQHPAASIATPLNGYHKIRQYDQPSVSVVIPVTDSHEKYLTYALTSLEGQTHRLWEAIVVDDRVDQSRPLTSDGRLPLDVGFPFVTVAKTGGGRGAGHARNVGASLARAHMLLFLDADDWLMPTAIEEMLNVFSQTGDAVYSDYIGIAYVEDPTKLSTQAQKDLLNYNEKTKIATITHRASGYDCELAMAQPTDKPYLWCNITTLIPKTWYDEVGGFDENMPSWEDVDFWWRIAKSGKCFVRIEKPLMAYRFHTGERRQIGLDSWSKIIEYLRDRDR